MTQGFYEQLGVSPTATLDEIRAAYTRVVGALLKRRKQVIEHGGDPEGLDVAHGQVTEAWKVLSDPVRRRRYDAMRALTGTDAVLDEEQLWKAVSGALIHPAAAAAVALLRTTTKLSLGDLPRAPGEPEPAPAPAAPKLAPRVPTPEPERTEHMTVVTQVPVTEVTEARPPRPSHIPARITPSAEFEPPPMSAAPGRPVAAVKARAPSSQPSPPAISLKPKIGSAGREAAARPGLKVVDGHDSSPVMVLPRAPVSNDERSPMGAGDVRRLVSELGTSGALLKAVRERQGLSLQELADATRISARYLGAIEDEAFEALPSATFVRGYVREMARQLGLDEGLLTKGYMRRFSPG